MISIICYAFVFLVESFISFYYFEIKFDRKIKKLFLFSIFTLFGIFSFIFSQINSIPILNAIVYLVINYLILTFCYYTSIRSRIFNTLALTILMIASETIVMSLLTFLFDSSIEQIIPNDTYLLSLSVLSKLVFFICAYTLARFTTKEKKQESFMLSSFLCILPLSSIIWVICAHYICLTNEIFDSIKITLSICNVLILLSNVVVFYVYEYTLKTNKKYTEILMLQQKEKNTSDYYELLKEQNDNSKILIHDITKHLNTIKQLSGDKESNISQYISNIVDDFSILNPVDYCNNSIVNLITHRYHEICQKNNIKFSINIKIANIDFIKDHDITALLDNLLGNAVESVIQTSDKFIDFSICTRNSNFIFIKVSNSCNKKPEQTNGILKSSKNSSGIHGIGNVSIKRVIDKYNGNLEMVYDNNTKTFTTTIGINAKQQPIYN